MIKGQIQQQISHLYFNVLQSCRIEIIISMRSMSEKKYFQIGHEVAVDSTSELKYKHRMAFLLLEYHPKTMMPEAETFSTY
jgi:hypothetical protein